MQQKWFKRKTYGWGWTPSTWQGWTIAALYIVLVILFTTTIDANSSPREWMFTFVLPFVFLTLTFVRIAYKKGESPKL